ncbi:MAG: hypothetical protein WC543_01060 [Candidatus Omnitrophota bacterium]
MEQKTKIIIIVLAVVAAACFFLFIQASSQQQTLVREANDLKSENSVLMNKVSQLENDLRSNQSKINDLKDERDKGLEALDGLQRKYDQAVKARDELIQKFKKQSQQEIRQPEISRVPESNDAYWGQILKAKTDLELQLSTIRTDLRSLQIANESLQREKSVLEMDVNSLRNEKKDLLRQLDYNQKLLDSMAQEVVRERNDKTGIQDSLKTLKNDNDILSRQLKSLNNRKSVLDQKVQSLQDGKSIVEKRLNEMDTMLTDRISQIDSLKNELDAIKSGKAGAITDKKKESVELPAIVVKSSPGAQKATVQEFLGKVLAVNTDNNFVVIDLGSAAGVKAGDMFNVFRAGKSIGTISVIQTRDNISACDIKRMSTALKIGDNIK